MSGEISREKESGIGGKISHDEDVVEQPLPGGEQPDCSEPTLRQSVQPSDQNQNQNQTVQPDIRLMEMVANGTSTTRPPPLVELDEAAASSEIPQAVGIAGAGSTSQQQQPKLPPLRAGDEEGAALSAAERHHRSVLNGLRTQQQLQNQTVCHHHENCQQDHQSQGSGGATTQPDARQGRQATNPQQMRQQVSIGVQPGQHVTLRVGEGSEPQRLVVRNGGPMRANHSTYSLHWHNQHRHQHRHHHHHHDHHHIGPLTHLPWPLRDDLDAKPGSRPPPWEQVTWSDVIPHVASNWITGPGLSLRARCELSEEGRDSGGEALASLYSCPVCLSHLSEPLEGRCHHAICGDCMANVFRSSTAASPPKCPICRTPFLSQGVQNSIAISEEHVRNMLPLSVECANDGCNARFTPLLSRHHASICPLSLYSCLYHPVGCQATVRIADMESHITSCPYKQIKGLYPHLFNPIKELQAIVSALDRQHRALGNILQLQINQLRAAATSSPNSTAPQNNAAARRDEGTVTTVPAPSSTISPSNNLSVGSDVAAMNNCHDDEQQVAQNGENRVGGSFTDSTDSSSDPQAPLLGFREAMTSLQGDQRGVVQHAMENETNSLRTENGNSQAMDFRETTNSNPQGDQQVVLNGVDADAGSLGMRENNHTQTLNIPGTAARNNIAGKHHSIVDGLGFQLFEFIRDYIGIICILWNLGGVVQIEDVCNFYSRNHLEAHAVAYIVVPVFLVLVKDFFVEYWNGSAALSNTCMTFTLLAAAMSSVSGQMVGSLPPVMYISRCTPNDYLGTTGSNTNVMIQCRNGRAINLMGAMLAVLSGLVLSASTYCVTNSLFNGSIWSAVILPITWYPIFCIQDAVIHRHEENPATEETSSPPVGYNHSHVGIWSGNICDIFSDLNNIRSRTMTKWAEFGYCLAVANMVFHISESNLFWGSVMEWICVRSARAILRETMVVTNSVLGDENNRNTELRWLFCVAAIFSAIGSILISSDTVLLSCAVIFCLQFALFVSRHIVTKLLLLLYSKPAATTQPGSSKQPLTRPDSDMPSSPFLGGNDCHSRHILSFTRPVLIVSIAAFFSLLLI